MTSELEAKGLIASTEHPWITSLHDLRIVSELAERPSVFLLFLRRRTDPRVTTKFRAIEELDYFMAFLNGKLYVETRSKCYGNRIATVRKGTSCGQTALCEPTN